MIETDVAIIGGGPAGSATSLYLARKGIRSVIIEKDAFPRYHIGESLTGEVGQRIRDLGMGDYMTSSNQPKKFGVNVYGPAGQHTFRVPVMERTDSSTLKPGQTWQVSRDGFDRQMLEQARKNGARMVNGKATGVLRNGNRLCGVRVATGEGNEQEVLSKVVVDASGQSTFLHSMGVTSRKHRGVYDKQVAVYSQLAGGLRNEGSEPDNTLILYKQKNHWAWFIPLSPDTVSVGVVVPSSYYQAKGESLEEFYLREVREVNPELRRRLPVMDLQEKVRGSSNYSYAIDQYVGDGFLCVGDAHRFIDPVFSFGVHFAIHEAELAADSINKHLQADNKSGICNFSEYQRICDLGMDTIQELIDAFWNNPHAFAFAAHYKYSEDIIDLFAGRIYEDNPSDGLLALRKINEVCRARQAAQ